LKGPPGSLAKSLINPLAAWTDMHSALSRMALSMVIQRRCQQISSWRRAAATIRFSAPGIPASLITAPSAILSGSDAATGTADPESSSATTGQYRNIPRKGTWTIIHSMSP
jgi:hypothetical protein